MTIRKSMIVTLKMWKFRSNYNLCTALLSTLIHSMMFQHQESGYNIMLANEVSGVALTDIKGTLIILSLYYVTYSFHLDRWHWMLHSFYFILYWLGTIMCSEFCVKNCAKFKSTEEWTRYWRVQIQVYCHIER